jgi:lipid II isoglutaminyl synthase (glutamine-hydrolysing)
MPVVLTIAIAKLILITSRIVGGGGGSALPGLVAEKLDASIGRKLAARITDGCIIITGTNGKTTTSKMLAQILTDSGEKLIINRAGSNLSRGVVSALIEHASWTGTFSQSMGQFEVDEAAMPAVAQMIHPRSIVVLNLFRDQLDRYGELDTTAQLIGRGIASSDAKLFLNADDPLVASLARYSQNLERVSYFGIEKLPIKALAHDVTADSRLCPVCSQPLKYSQIFYGHIGHYKCPDGHITRPAPAIKADSVKLSETTVATVSSRDDKAQLKLNLPGTYNLYNALAATAVAADLGLSLQASIQSLERVEAAFGRVEKIVVGTKKVQLLLVKNPTGFNQILQTFLLNKKQQNVFIAINDNFADGRDISWLWDVAFEDISSNKHQISISGSRATDMALRLKYADISAADYNTNIPNSLNSFINQMPENSEGYVIPTYTAMLQIREQLGRKAKLKGVWE